MLYSRFDHAIRRLVPSAAKLSYNPIAKYTANAIASILSAPFSEFRELPPNHLRMRIGVGNRILANHAQFMEMGTNTWLHFLANQYCNASSDVLELGCGCGRIARPLKGSWFKGTYTGVDIDEEMIRYCREHFPAPKFQFILSPHVSSTYSARSQISSQEEEDEGKIDIAATDSKDFVFSISLYSHLLERELHQYLQISRRLLRRGGIMHFTFFCMQHVKLGVRWTFQHRIGNSYVESEILPEAAVAYDEDYIRSAVTRHGFEDVEITPYDVQSVLIAKKSRQDISGL